MKVVIAILLFASLFSLFQAIYMKRFHTSPYEEAVKKIKKVRNSKKVIDFMTRKEIFLKQYGANIYLSESISTSKWYIYKLSISSILSFIGLVIGKAMIKTDAKFILAVGLFILGWFFLDVYIHLQNKAGNEDMMDDICEMSRSVLYGKRGGQYIADALRDSVIVVENKRLKMALIKLRNDLDASIPLDECLEELEMSFKSAEVSSFCTVIKALQSTGQVDEALKTLENNIEREQVGVNKRRCIVLENKTMMYVMVIAFDILAVILYCIVMKLLEMQIAF